MVPKVWKWVAIVLGILIILAVVVGLAGGFRWLCGRFYAVQPDGSEPEAGAVIASLLGSSPSIQVAGGTGQAAERTFQLYAWYRDANGKVVSGRFDPLKWELTPPSANTVSNGSVTV